MQFLDRGRAQRLCLHGYVSMDAWILALAFQGYHAVRSTFAAQALDAQASGDYDPLLETITQTFATRAVELGIR